MCKVKKFDELFENQNIESQNNEFDVEDRLYEEFSRIDDNTDQLGCNIKVYGNGVGTRSEHNPPHFHIEDHRSNLDIRVKIPTIQEWKDNPVLEIVQHSANTQNNWSSLRSLRENVTEWLSKKHTVLTQSSNLYFMILEWNNNNKDNSNVNKLPFDVREDL